MFCDSAEFYILKPYNALKNIFCCIKILFFILMFYLVLFYSFSYAFVDQEYEHEYYNRILDWDNPPKTSEIDLDKFILNSAFVDSGKYTEDQIKSSLFEDVNYKSFKTVMELDQYKYITILQDDSLYSYYVILSNNPLKYDKRRVHLYGSSYEDRYYLECDTEFYSISINALTCGAPVLESSSYSKKIHNLADNVGSTKFGVYNYFYYFSTCGINKPSGEVYSNKFMSFTKGIEISKRLPILSITYDFFIQDHVTFLPYNYLFDGTTVKANIFSKDMNLLFIKSSNFNNLLPVGKLYTHQLINGKFKLYILKQNEENKYLMEKEYKLSVVSKSSLNNEQGGVVPFFGDGEKILYYQVYFPKYNFDNCIIWCSYDNEGLFHYYSSLFFINSKTSNDIVIDSLPSGDEIDDTSGDSSGDIYEGLENSINDLNNNITNGFDNLNNTIQETSKNFLQNLLDSILGFFIPADDFFSNYFQELSDWFSDRLGLLYYPIDLFLDFINRCLNINFDNQIMKIGPYNLNFGDESFQLVPELVFDFSTFTEDENLKMIHETYYLIVDGLIIFGLVRLIQSKYEEVFKK